MLHQMTLWDIRNATFLPESACGATPCVKPAGQIPAQHGPDPALANHSARQAKAKGLMMSGTYGRTFTGLSNSASLSASLANKLRAKTDLLGSTLYKLTWRERRTPAGRLIPALRASVLRISDKGFTGWPTPLTSDCTGGGQAKRALTKSNLNDHVMLAGWPTPQANKNTKTAKTLTG